MRSQKVLRQGSLGDKILDCKPLEKNIVLDLGFMPEHLGVAPEAIVKSYDDFANCNFSVITDKNAALNICCFLPEVESNLEFIFQILSLLNKLPESSISLYLHKSLYESIAQYCNNHICVYAYDQDKALSISTSIVITYGASVIHFLRNNIPVLVLGPYGLGGFVTSGNLPFLYQFGFMGRPGSNSSEVVPIEMLAHELCLFKEAVNLDEVLSRNKSIAEAYSINSLSEEKLRQKESCEKLHSFYNDFVKRNSLKPILCSNLRLLYNNDQVFIERTYVNDTLCTLDRADAPFFHDLNGQNTCLDLQKKHGLNEEDFWDMMPSLLHKQIITMSL